MIILSGIVRNTLLSIAIIFIFYYTITYPLFRIANEASRVDTTAPAKKLIQTPKKHEKNELGLLIETLNNVLVGFEKSLEKQQTAEQKMLEQNQELIRINKLKDEFLANTSHELRTPLNGIIGIAESLYDGAIGKISKPQQDNILLITTSARRLTNLVNDILDYSKLRHKDFDLQLKTVDIKEVTEVVLLLSKSFEQTKNIKLINNIQPITPYIYADENRIQQIMHNLIGNAIKFTESGSITVSAKVQDKSVVITVSDTGIGIPKKHFNNIFESFEQIDGSTSRKYGGTGIGLAITKNLVELHGGKIWVESELGKGSDFHFSINISPNKFISTHSDDITITPDPFSIRNMTSVIIPEQNETLNIETDEFTLKTLDGFHILAVDDEPINLQVIKNNLIFNGAKVSTASSGAKALRHLKDNKPDLVLMDVMMPQMNGYEVTRFIRNHFSKETLPGNFFLIAGFFLQQYHMGMDHLWVYHFPKGHSL